MALPPRDQRHQYLRFEGLGYTYADITDFEERLGRIYDREIHRVLVFDFGGLIDLMAEELSSRMLIELIAYNIAGRSQAPDKVTMIDLFYLRGMNVGSVNIPYLLARYLRLFASGRKRETVIVQDLHMIDIAEMARLQICEELDDTWAWAILAPVHAPKPHAAGLARTIRQRTSLEKKSTKLVKYRSSGILCVL
nr:hypothetical protein [Tanacetum cinerariifolium]